MGVFYFPSNFVYWQKVKDHDIIKDVLLKEIYKHEDVKKIKNGNGLYAASTSFNNREEDNLLNDHDYDQNTIKNIVWDPLENAIAELNSRDNTVNISFSMIYILKDENERNQTVFTESTHECISTTSSDIQETMFDTSLIKDIKEGSVLIFPSSLYHYVRLVEKPGRITVAVNLGSWNH